MVTINKKRTGGEVGAGRRRARLAAATATLALVSGLGLQAASAATGSWYAVPGTSAVRGYAIIDGHSHSGGKYYANGRAELVLDHSCGYIKWAPFADYVADGSYTKLQRYCGTGAVVLKWSDWEYYGYDGYKFQACSDTACGKELHIYY